MFPCGPTVPTRSRVAPGEPPASPTACCVGSATTRRSRATAPSIATWPGPACASMRWTSGASIGSTARSSMRCFGSSMGDPSDYPPWRLRSARRRRPSRKWPSPSSSGVASSHAPHVAEWPPLPHGVISGSPHRAGLAGTAGPGLFDLGCGELSLVVPVPARGLVTVTFGRGWSVVHPYPCLDSAGPRHANPSSPT